MVSSRTLPIGRGSVAHPSAEALRGLPSYDWDVRASDRETGTKFCRWLSAAVIGKLGEVKTLSPAGKAELNRLLAEGVPLAEAMKRVPVERPQDLATRFAWPIPKS